MSQSFTILIQLILVLQISIVFKFQISMPNNEYNYSPEDNFYSYQVLDVVLDWQQTEFVNWAGDRTSSAC